jgi:hypothetical protein
MVQIHYTVDMTVADVPDGLNVINTLDGGKPSSLYDKVSLANEYQVGIEGVVIPISNIPFLIMKQDETAADPLATTAQICIAHKKDNCETIIFSAALKMPAPVPGEKQWYVSDQIMLDSMINDALAVCMRQLSAEPISIQTPASGRRELILNLNDFTSFLHGKRCRTQIWCNAEAEKLLNDFRFIRPVEPFVPPGSPFIHCIQVCDQEVLLYGQHNVKVRAATVLPKNLEVIQFEIWLGSLLLAPVRIHPMRGVFAQAFEYYPTNARIIQWFELPPITSGGISVLPQQIHAHIRWVDQSGQSHPLIRDGSECRVNLVFRHKKYYSVHLESTYAAMLG